MAVAGPLVYGVYYPPNGNSSIATLSTCCNPQLIVLHTAHLHWRTAQGTWLRQLRRNGELLGLQIRGLGCRGYRINVSSCAALPPLEHHLTPDYISAT